MERMLAELLSKFERDIWREQNEFSPELISAHERLFQPHLKEPEAAAILNTWIGRYQPCIFGKIAAAQGLLHFCVLTEEELSKGDEFVKERIQKARLAWTRAAYEGTKNAFVIAIRSKRAAEAVPSEIVKQFALRLAELYLVEPIEPDRVYTDRIWLEKPGPARTTWEWFAGINYFSSQGDGRWWQDHRIPGGIAFSINSVGHMVKSSIISKAMRELDQSLDVESEEWSRTKVDSLGKALELAMRTINNASNAVSGPATKLLNQPSDNSGRPLGTCPSALPEALAKHDFSQYFGFYHTDRTVPSDYFTPEVHRPAGIRGHILDFTYLFDRRPANPDHVTMGSGRRIRADDDGRGSPQATRIARYNKVDATEVLIAECGRLQLALGELRC